MKEIAGVASLMVHLNRSSLAGASLIQPVMDRMVQEGGHVQVSLHWGDQVLAALMGSLMHGLPLQLQIQDPVAVHASEGTGGAAVAVQASPTLGAVRKGLLRDQDALQQGVDAILVIEGVWRRRKFDRSTEAIGDLSHWDSFCRK